MSTDEKDAKRVELAFEFNMGDATAAHRRSEGDINTAIDIFNTPKTDVAYNGYRMVEMSPTTTSITPMEFVVPALTDYVDLGRSYFQLKLRLKNTDNTNVVAASNHIVNNLAHSIIKYISMRLNGVLISPQTDTYPYKAFFETLLNYNRDEGETILAPQGWMNVFDVPARLEVTDAGDDTLKVTGHSDAQKVNRALLETATGDYVGKTHWLVFKPHLEVFHTGKVLVPNTEIKIQFHFNDPDFWTYGRNLGQTTNKKLRLLPEDIEIKFILCQLRLNQAVYKGLAFERANKPAVVYPVVRSEIRTYTFQGTTDNWEETNIFQGRIPDRMIVGLLDAKAFNGDKDYYPFAFQKFGLESIKQIVRGEEYPYETLQLNGTNSTRDKLGFFRFVLASGARKKSVPTMLQPSDWGQSKNCTLFMFDNVASGDADSRMLNPRQSGDLQLKIKFNTAPGKVITVLIFGEFENLMEVDRFGAVLYNIYERNL